MKKPMEQRTRKIKIAANINLSSQIYQLNLGTQLLIHTLCTKIDEVFSYANNKTIHLRELAYDYRKKAGISPISIIVRLMKQRIFNTIILDYLC